MGIFRLNGVVGKRAPTIYKLVGEELEQLNLLAVKRIAVSYDPFDQRSIATRKFLEFLNRPRVVKKYPNTNITATIKCDRSEPTVSFDLVTGKKVLFKAGNLSTLEMFELYNRHITPHAPEEEKPRETLSAKAMRKGK